MKIRNLMFVMLAGTAIFASSCTKTATTPTPTPVDPRDQLVGNYFLTDTVVVYISKAKPAPFGKDTVEVYNSTLTVSKDASFADRIDITETDSNGKTSYYANGVTNASNGATFSIPSQTISATSTTGATGVIQGTSAYSLGSGKFDGGYISNSRTLNFGYKGTISFVANGTNFVIPFLDIKHGNKH